MMPLQHFYCSGIPKSVENLQINVEDTHVSLSWSMHYNSGDAIDSDIRYKVLILNMTSSETTTESTFLNLIFLRFAPRHLGCDDFIFQIVPINPVGTGEATSITLFNQGNAHTSINVSVHT